MLCRHSVPVYVVHLLLPEPALLDEWAETYKAPSLKISLWIQSIPVWASIPEDCLAFIRQFFTDCGDF